MKKTLLLAASAACAIAALAGNPSGDEIAFAPVMTEIVTSPGATFELPFTLTNTVQCVAFEWTVEKNDCFSVVKNQEEDTYMVDFGDRLTGNYRTFTQYHELTDDFKVVAVNMSAEQLMAARNGVLCTMTFKVDPDAPKKVYELRILDAKFNWFDAEDDVCTITVPTTAIAINVTDSSSGITDMEAEPEPEGCYYDLSGRPVAHPTPGIYIRNGHKVIVK